MVISFSHFWVYCLKLRHFEIATLREKIPRLTNSLICLWDVISIGRTIFRVIIIEDIALLPGVYFREQVSVHLYIYG